MFRSIWEYIKNLLGIKSETTNYQAITNSRYATNYKDIRNINFTSIFANKFASLVKNESEIIVTDDYDTPSVRTELLNDIVKRTFGKDGKKILSRMLGTGAAILVPFVSRNKLYASLITQDRFFINKRIGDDIYSATVLAEIKTIDEKKYYRWINYDLDENNTYHITSLATTESGIIPMSLVPGWEDYEQQISITNCERMLFANFRCPIDSRKDDDTYAVPITYGCEKTIKDIYECLEQIANEYEAKRVFVGMDSRMFGKGNVLPENGLFKKLEPSGNDGDFWEIFDPAIRDSSYYARLTNLYDLLEKQVGTSKGILTEKTSQYATATEIKSANYDTYAIVDDIRKEVERGMEDFVYACNVLIDYYNLAPAGEYQLVFNWSYALIENSSETFQQYSEAVSKGVMDEAELRQYLMSNETLEESKKRVEEIKKEKQKEALEEQEQQLALDIKRQSVTNSNEVENNENKKEKENEEA